MTISERIVAPRRGVAGPDAGFPFRLAAGAGRRERTRALASARAEGDPDPHSAAAIRLLPSRVHQIVADADLDAVDCPTGGRNVAGGWPGRASPLVAPVDGAG